MEKDEPKPVTLFEQHAQTIVAAVTLAILVGAGTLLLNMRDDIASMKAEVRHMGEQLKNAGDDRFRGADWRQQKAILDERFYDLRSQVKELEKRIEAVERAKDKLR